MNNQEASSKSELIRTSGTKHREANARVSKIHPSTRQQTTTNNQILATVTTNSLGSTNSALEEKEKSHKKIVSPERSSIRLPNSNVNSRPHSTLSPTSATDSNQGDYTKSPGNTHPQLQSRNFPRTPQYDHIYLDLKSPASSSPLKQVRLADDVILTPKRSYLSLSPRRTSQDEFSLSSTGNSESNGTAEVSRTASHYRGVPTVTPSRERNNTSNLRSFSSLRTPYIPPQRKYNMVTATASNMNSNSALVEKPNSASERRNIEPTGKLATHVISQNAVELILKRPEGEGTNNGPYSQMTRGDEPLKKSSPKKFSPPRTLQTSEEKEANANVVTPMDAGGQGHNRSSSYTSTGFESTFPNVPESPHPSSHSQQNPTYYNMPSPYPSSDPQGYYNYQPSSPMKGDHESVEQPPTPQGAYTHSGSNLGYFPPHGQAQPAYYSSSHGGYPPHREPYYGTDYEASPGKRPRLAGTPSRDEVAKRHKEHSGINHSGDYPNGAYHSGRGHVRNKSAGGVPASDSFDSGDPRRYHGAPGPFPHEHEVASPQRMSRKIIPPPVLKSSSYPPPPPNHLYRTSGESASSYPGTKGHGKPSAMDEYPRGYFGHHPPPPPRSGQYYPGDFHGSQRYEHGGAPPQEQYYSNPRAKQRQEPPSPQVSGGFYPGETAHDLSYPRAGPPSHQDAVHPVTRDHDISRDRLPPGGEATLDDLDSRKSNTSKSKSKVGTPARKGKKSQIIVGTDSKTSTPKRKPGSAAQAAIAAGMTQPPSAREVDFDIHNPPMTPQVPPSTQPICAIPSNVNSHDVLCGRGGGTNTQIGNRRFRSLVHEFQPTYLLCRRKEKPLIARTIVLIIRNRGGRFLKKDDVNGMLFEVGDDKAEAKTSQALREGLDVRSAKSPSAGKRKSRKKKAQIGSGKSKLKLENDLFDAQNTGMADNGREGPPPHDSMFQYAPPQGHPYYYSGGGGGGYPENYYTNYDYPQQQPFSPTRKRQRAPPPALPQTSLEAGYSYNQQYPPKAYLPQTAAQEYYNYPPQMSEAQAGPEEENIWEMDFSPPRASTKKEPDVKAEDHEVQHH